MIEQPTTPTVRQVTVEHVQQQIAQMILFIEMRDYEKAHLVEDQLFIDILRAIATDRCDDAKACATEAIKSDRLAYPRWAS